LKIIKEFFESLRDSRHALETMSYCKYQFEKIRANTTISAANWLGLTIKLLKVTRRSLWLVSDLSQPLWLEGRVTRFKSWLEEH